MELRDLRYFLSVAELGSLQRAATLAGRSQPAFSKSIKRLETALGAKLISRDGRGSRLTPAGEHLRARARAICHSVEDMVDELTSVADGSAGHVRIGTVPSLADSIMADACHMLLGHSERLSLSVTMEMTDQLRRLLRAAEVDILVAPLTANDKQEFLHRTITRDDLVVAASASHPLARRRVAMKDLAPYGWLLPPDTSFSRQWLNQQFAQRGLPSPNARIEANSVRMLRSTVAKTNLLTFIARSELQAHAEPRLEEITNPETTMQREIAVIYLRKGYMPPAAEGVIEVLLRARASRKTVTSDRCIR